MSKRLMRYNAELGRNVLLECPPQKLMTAALMLGVVYICIWLLAGDGGAAKGWIGFSKAAFYFMAVVWGSAAAAKSVAEEWNTGTWDLQRMNSLTPWQMTVGKTFGSTSFVWLVALAAMCVLCVSMLQSGHGADVPVTALAMLATALLAQGLGLLLTLAQMMHSSANEKVSYIGSMTAGIFLSSIGYSLIESISERGLSKPLVWYVFSLRKDWFALGVTVFYAVWMMAGAYLLMRRELQYRHGPWGIPLFQVTSMFLFAGLALGEAESGWRRVEEAAAVAAVFGVWIHYMALLSDAGGSVEYRRLRHHWIRRSTRDFWLELPSWVVTSAPMALSLVFVALTAGVIGESAMLRDKPPMAMLWMSVAALGFVLRDTLMIVGIRVKAARKRVGARVTLYFVIVYAILPLLLMALNPSGRLTPLAFPMPDHMNPFVTALVWMEVAGALMYLRSGWMENVKAEPVRVMEE